MNVSTPRQLSRPILTKMPGRLLDVVARGLHEARHLPQLRHDAAGALGLRRVGEERLAGQADADGVGVHLRTPVPGPDRLELVHPRLDVRGDDGVLDLLDGVRCDGVDLIEAAAEAREGANVAVDARAGSDPRAGRRAGGRRPGSPG